MGVTIFLVLIGLLMIYSASSVSDYVHNADSAYHLKRQLSFLAIGAAAMFAGTRLDLRYSSRGAGLLRDPESLGWIIWGASVIGLLAVLVVGIGKWGAQRWILIGPIPIQPSEFAKLGCILTAAVLLAEWKRHEIDGGQLATRLALVMVPVIVLVMAQPDMGTTVSIVASIYLLCWLGDVSGRLLAAVAVSGGVLGGLMIWIEPYRFSRLMAFVDPWKDPKGDGFQIIQSLYAFGSGGITGVGLGLSKQKFFYLPAAHTDFIFAIIGEELGLIGTLLIAAAFGVMAYAGIRISLSAKNNFDRLLAGGLTAMIVTQAVMNMAAVTGLMPITGIPLPLVSYGGSSLIFTLACIGLVLGVARRSSGSTAVRAKSKRHEPDVTDITAVRTSKTRGSNSAVSVERRRNGRPYLSGIDGGKPPRRKRA
ncbi:MAG: putative lipid II flippase FtsW [Actinobacteria bacterium HGW-Actinobacteria-6]|nr:MAG: putative lipid II flippase FtsW [Actinobacteria bacterium HGW-Actinobacteria-6]